MQTHTFVKRQSRAGNHEVPLNRNEGRAQSVDPASHAMKIGPAVRVVAGGVHAAAAADMRAHSTGVELRQRSNDLGEPERPPALVAQPPRRLKHLPLYRFVARQGRSRCPLPPWSILSARSTCLRRQLERLGPVRLQPERAPDLGASAPCVGTAMRKRSGSARFVRRRAGVSYPATDCTCRRTTRRPEVRCPYRRRFRLSPSLRLPNAACAVSTMSGWMRARRCAGRSTRLSSMTMPSASGEGVPGFCCGRLRRRLAVLPCRPLPSVRGLSSRGWRRDRAPTAC